MLIPDFKVLHMVLTVIIHVLYVKESFPKILEKVFFSFFLIFFYLEDEEYGVPCDTVVTGILDMRAGKHNLHFLIGVELLPHAFVNIPDETIHIGVFTFIFITCFIFIIINVFL
jgi:hypothetical protein